MESLQLRSGVSLRPLQPAPRKPISCHSVARQRFRTGTVSGGLQTGSRIGAAAVLVRARGDGGEEDAATASSRLGVADEEKAKRRPLWQRAWGLGGKALGLRFGEGAWEDPRGQRELEELDSFLEGRGVEFRWQDVLEPSVENVLAVVLTGLLLYAILLIGWQLLLVAAAITLSALKYSVIAAVVLGVLIFFL